MNKGRRGQAPIRTRRRQSDAKWRASVASCYETLKFVIPNKDALPKRKTSKALVLQETEKHIIELEKAISHILSIEAQEKGVGVLWRKGQHWAPATLDDVRQDFSEKQRQIFNQAVQGRRCYNLLHDIQDEILGVSARSSSLAYIRLQDNEDRKHTKDASTCTGKRRHKVSRSRCRHEAERACQRLLSTHKTGDIVKAIIPTDDSSSSLRQLPLCSSFREKCTCTRAALSNRQGEEVNLVKVGNIFISAGKSDKQLAPDEANFKEQQHHPHQQQQHELTVQEVPVLLTPNKPYGIARNDVMMSAEHCEVADVFNSTLHGYSTPLAGRELSVEELGGSLLHSPELSNVCKKLDFSMPLLEMPETGGNASLLFPHRSTFMSATTTFMDMTPGHGNADVASYGCLTSPGTVSDGTGGFTPVKLPLDACVPVSPLLSPNPAWSLGATMDARVPQATTNDFDEADIEGGRSLLCMENFDLDDINDKNTHKQRTPVKQSGAHKRKPHHECRCKRKSTAYDPNTRESEIRGRPRPKCRKRLEDLYARSSWKKESKDAVVDPMEARFSVDSLSRFCDFDGYLLYYRQVAPDLKKRLGSTHDAHAVAAIVSDMWTKLPSDDRHTMVTLAALENQDSNSSGSASLSQDLEELDIKPLNEGLYQGI
ncbi:hypothetical protein C0Q70_05290 [Pomacea canaliculata]|uniref:BHLH domain-containing protein n=2 Tax=Pomacea canaliculata TaxID=400727 RepID=A0A2T7PKT8_POMCA|nr:uncharacterized protein LOC112560580 isoform X2 [Pomacea canaliculata]PVD34028.1 hypothetical protein C0Q70_05290 [Pomacea canaliculata]